MADAARWGAAPASPACVCLCVVLHILSVESAACRWKVQLRTQWQGNDVFLSLLLG